MRNKKAKSVALAGILTALAVVFLLAGSLLDILDLTMAAVAALVVMIALIELGKGWAVGVYAAASVLSILLLPTTASIVFAGFIGCYPVIKVYLDRIPSKILQYLAKFGCFNLFLAAALLIIWWMFGAENEWIAMAKWLVPLANLTFIIFDFCLAKLAVFYLVKIRPRLFRGSH